MLDSEGGELGLAAMGWEGMGCGWHFPLRGQGQERGPWSGEQSLIGHKVC